MARSPRFLALVFLHLCVPAAVYLLVGLYDGRTLGIEYLLPNYLFMAAPHLLVSLLVIWPEARRPTLLWVLSLLNVLLVTYQLWVLLAVAPDDGFAWIFYIPLWGLALLACAIAWGIVRDSGPTPKGGAG
ncbi:hypothetical protein HDE79_002224 [Rhodanobacter sp. MP1X3]|nr:hypothetical protein [Rhodanobacter sp. MP1X3]